MRRSLVYFWRLNLAVMLGAAVATAVLTGALLVGDSVKGSLRDLTLERLGGIDYVMLTRDFHREELASDLAATPGFSEKFRAAAPAILVNGSAVQAKTRARASRINILGADERFMGLYALDSKSDPFKELAAAGDRPFPAIVINRALQGELHAQVGDQIILSFEKPSDIARGSLLGHKDSEAVIQAVRCRLVDVVADQGVGRFGLRPHQALPLNAFVSMPALRKALQRPGAANLFAVAQTDGGETEDHSGVLQDLLKSVVTIEDLGLELRPANAGVVLASREAVLSETTTSIAEAVTKELGFQALPSYTYLANAIRKGDRLTPYSTVTGLDLPVAQPFSQLTLLSGKAAAPLQGNDILLNEWAANDLRARPGDTVEMTYFAVGERDQLYTQEQEFVVKGIVAMTGLAIDKNLTPEFPGIADAENMADWDPPFEVDLSLIRPKDELYWDKYHSAPKAFVALNRGRELWRSRFGATTSVRLEAQTAAARDEFVDRFMTRVVPEEFDLAFAPVKVQGLKSSQGATDFSGLFIGFSLFLIVSASLIVALLFRLGIEQRTKEIGVLLSLGFPGKRIRRQFLKEGLLLSAAGAVLGLGGAVAYAGLMMAGLRSWWLAAVGSPFLFLHVTTTSLAIGYFVSVFVVLLSIWLGFRKVSKVPAPVLLAGGVAQRAAQTAGAGRKWLALGTLALALILASVPYVLPGVAKTGIFFGVGTLLLISGLVFFSIWLRGKHRTISVRQRVVSLARLGARNTPRNPGRSLLSTALVASACFVIVAVGANRVDFGKELLEKNSGAGGFNLIAQSDIPLLHDLTTEDGRFELGFSDEDSELLTQASIIPFRYLPGDDASCLNLYQVDKPRLLGVPAAQVERGGFSFQQIVGLDQAGVSTPWQLLTQETEADVIPAFGDFNSVLWILHSGLGKDVKIVDEFGKEVRLRFVGLFKKSIFQSELLISEQNFLKHFPSRSGYSYYLFATTPETSSRHAGMLEATLSDYGFDLTTTAERLTNFQAVENTYLSTFQTLGGLGLLLGTVGLGIILIRSVVERRGELATLRAFGFRRSILAVLVVAENGFLLGLGIAIGGIAAVIAVAPHVLADVAQIPWWSLAGSLLAVFLVGMLASIAAVLLALRIPLLPALRAE